MSDPTPTAWDKSWAEYLAHCKRRAPTGLKIHSAVWNFRPWGRRCLVRLLDPQEMTEGGIYIPETANRICAAGWIMTAGPQFGSREGESRHPAPLDPWEAAGRKVLFGDYVGHELKFQSIDESFDRNLYLIMNDDDILGEIDKD